MTTERQIAYDPKATYPIRAFDVEYMPAAGQAWLARVYQPETPGLFPALLDIHGGAWSGGDRLGDELIDRALASAGLVVVSIDFRVAPEHPYPAQVQDANYAVRWLKAHARELGADASLVGALGRSSGGHTALLLGLRPRDPAFNAIPLPEAPEVDASLDFVLGLWPVLDSYARYQIARENERTSLVEASLGYFLTEEGMQQGNPQGVLERGEQEALPPTMVLHGSADTNVPLHLVEWFAEKYRVAGGRFTLEVFPDQPHTFAAEPGSTTDRAVELLRGFVASQVAAWKPSG
jgi:acetyl esterase/lipase